MLNRLSISFKVLTLGGAIRWKLIPYPVRTGKKK